MGHILSFVPLRIRLFFKRLACTDIVVGGVGEGAASVLAVVFKLELLNKVLVGQVREDSVNVAVL